MVDAGSTAIVVGEGVSTAQEVWVLSPSVTDAETLASFASTDPGSRPALPATPPAGAVQSMVVGERSNKTIAIKQPGGKATNVGVFTSIVWLKNEHGFSKPYVYNLPKLYFSSDPFVVPGQDIKLYGKNFTTPYNDNMSTFYVGFKNKATGARYSGANFITLFQTNTNYTDYIQHVRTPSDMPPGDYEVYVNNATLGHYSWSNTIDIKVVEELSLVQAMARNSSAATVAPLLRKTPAASVTPDNIASDGITDSTDAIQSAIDEMSANGGGVVILPVGNIAISRMIDIKEGVVLSGRGMGATTLMVPPSSRMQGAFPFTQAQLYRASGGMPGNVIGDYWGFMQNKVPMVLLGTNAGLQDLTVDCGAGADVALLIGTANEDMLVKDSFVKRCKLLNKHELVQEQTGGWTPQFGGILGAAATENVVIEDNEILASMPVWMLASRFPHRFLKFVGNDVAAYPLTTANGVFINSMEKCLVADNFIHDSCRGFTSQNGMKETVILNNVMDRIHGIDNATELLMSETGGSDVLGKVGSATENTMTPATQLPYADHATLVGQILYIYIMSGRGYGQVREIIDNDKNTFTVSEDWAVVPDATSTFSIHKMADSNSFLRNTMTNTRGALMATYGAGFANVVGGNEIYALGGIASVCWASYAADENGGKPTYDIMIGNKFHDNRMVNTTGISLDCIYQEGSAYGDDLMLENGPGYANFVTRNSFFGSTGDMPNQYGHLWTVDHFYTRGQNATIRISNLAYTVVDNNYLYDPMNGILLNRAKNTILLDNMMEYVRYERFTERNSFGTYSIPYHGEEPYKSN